MGDTVTVHPNADDKGRKHQSNYHHRPIDGSFGRRFSRLRQGSRSRQDSDPRRRRSDDRKHRRGLRTGLETRRRRPDRARQLGPRGETFAVDALTSVLKYHAEGNVA